MTGTRVSVESVCRRVRVARGRAPGDLMLRNGRVVNVFTGEIEPADVVIADGWIAAVGASDVTASEEIDLNGAVVAPGLIDAHMHIESTLLTPAQFARLVVPRGTTTVIADPHEIGNVLGVRGVEQMIRASEGLPVDCLFMAPSCVPASSFERAGATLDAEALAGLMAHERVVGLGEMMNFPGILEGDASVVSKVVAALEFGHRVDGHAPGVVGDDLGAYAAAGIRSDHECTTAEEARARAALGMLVQVREGSMARNLDAMVPDIKASRLGAWCLCTDDVHPEDLLNDGHIDPLIRRLVKAGVDPAVVLRHASFVPARHYGLRDRGAVSPGFRADLVVFEDLEAFAASLVLKNGEVVARDGACVSTNPDPVVETENTVHLGPIDERVFELTIPDSSSPLPVIGVIPDQIVTTHETIDAGAIATDDGRWAFDADVDLALLACIQRHEPSGDHGLGLVRGFGFRRHGAIGSSVGHDAHNLTIAGTNPADMLRVTQTLAEIGGGFVVVRDGEVTARMPLPFAGLMSTLAAPDVCREQELVNRAAADLGCPLHSPFGTLSFLPLTVIPSLRITDQGMFDVERWALV